MKRLDVSGYDDLGCFCFTVSWYLKNHKLVKTGRERKSSSGLISSQFKKSPGMGEWGRKQFWPVSKQVTVSSGADCPGLLTPRHCSFPTRTAGPSSGSVTHHLLCTLRKWGRTKPSMHHPEGQLWFRTWPTSQPPVLCSHHLNSCYYPDTACLL